MDANLLETLQDVKGRLHGCESLSVASDDGFVLATTVDDARRSEFLAAVTSYLLTSCARGLEPYRAGECRALDYRGDRQILLIRLNEVGAYLVAVLHPGAQALNLDEPALRSMTSSLPDYLFGKPVEPAVRWYLERDKNCRIPVKHGGLRIGAGRKNDLVVFSPKVDEEHVLVELLGDGLIAEDLETVHQTRLNGRKFTGRVELGPGDRLTLPAARGFTVVAIDLAGNELEPGEVAAAQRRGARS